MPGRGSLLLCYQCKRWADKNPGTTNFPRPGVRRPSLEGRRIRTFATIFIIGSFGIFALGLTIALTMGRIRAGAIMILGALSLFFLGVSMKRFSEK